MEVTVTVLLFPTLLLEKLAVIDHVNITFVGGIDTACFLEKSATSDKGFNIEFVSVIGFSGNMPLLQASTNKLEGLRRVDISRIVRGDAPLSGSYRLSFRDAITSVIVVSANTSDIENRNKSY